MYNLNLFSNDNVAEDGKEREDSWQRRFSIYNKKRNVVDFETICEISDTGSTLICMGNDDYFMTSINKFGRQLINMGFYSPWLRKEEVADHCNTVGHLDGPLARVKTLRVYAHWRKAKQCDATN